LAITAIKEVLDSSGLGWSANSSGTIRRAVRKFVLTSNAATDTCATADAYSGLPQANEGYPGISWLRVSDRQTEKIDTLHFSCTVSYSQTESDDPTSQDVEVEWDFVESEEDIDTDAYDHPIVNTNGEGFDPPVTREYGNLVLRAARNEATYNATYASEFYNTVNSGTFLGFPSGKVLCKKISASLVTLDNGYQYWRLTYIFHLRKDGWKKRILNRGYMVKATADAEAKRKVDENGYVTEPVLLAADGTETTKENPYWLEFEVYESTSFGALNLE